MLNTDRQSSAPSSEHSQELELVSRAACGDEAAFELIMRRYNQKLFRTARSILRNDEEAEDVVQEAYMRAWRALGNFRSDARLSTWLVRIVANEALGRLRRKSPQILTLDDAMNSPEPDIQASLTDEPSRRPEHAAMRAQLRTLLEARIDLLPEAFRAVFMLRAVEEMNVEEVSQALNIPEATVRTRFFRARTLLRESLAGDLDVTLAEVFTFDGARCDRIVAGVLARIRGERPSSGR
ncbi:MAG: RNA polymerase sigma factor [Nitrospira sp.]|nr:RNA polymerase sigma factor [Nitrospira sp.]